MSCAKNASWLNPRVLLTLTVVFLCGASAGMLLMAMGAHRWMHRTFDPQYSQLYWDDTGKAVSLQQLKKELNLTADQVTQLELVLDDFSTYCHTLKAQFDDVRASGKERIMRILNDGQKRKFEKIVSDKQDRRR